MGSLLISLISFILKPFQWIGDVTIWLVNTIAVSIVYILGKFWSLLSIVVHILQGKYHSLKNTLKRLYEWIKLSRRPTQLPRMRRHESRPIYSVQRNVRQKTIEKDISKTQFIPRRVTYFIAGFVLATFLVTIAAFVHSFSKELPNPRMLVLRDVPVTSKIFDKNGELLYEIYTDQNRTPVTLGEIPDYFKQATIAIEDRNFYNHQGFSPKGIVRATYNIIVEDELQGGSTITQQLVRSALLDREVSIKRKVKELILSVWTEQLYSKNEILTMYLNQVPYGGTAWGAEAAAKQYFGKSIRNVTLSEAALLAGLPAAPTRFSPFGAHPELAVIRQKEVLRRMNEDGYITDEEREIAEHETLSFRRPNIGINAPHFVMYVKDVLTERYGERMVEQGGLQVTTTLDLKLQNRLQEIVANEVESLRGLMVGNGALIVTNPNTGHVLAMVGSTNYFDLEKEGNVNIALTAQQPGSTIKVVTYTAALQDGYTAATLINDSPITYNIQGSRPYSPVNYDGRFHGYVPLRQALGNSYNIPAVRTLAKIGLPTMVEQGRHMGITSWKDINNYGLSLTLGGGEVTMLEMASVYGTLANKGVKVPITPILRVTDHLGNVIEDNSSQKGKQVVPEEVAFIISDILSDNASRTATFGANSVLNIPNSWVAVKTGTSNDKRDNWAIGYTSDFVVVAWVGNNDNSPMHPTLSSGITGATPIWRKATDLLLEMYQSDKPSVPSGVELKPCRGRMEYFVKGSDTLSACRPIPTPTPSEEPTPTLD